MSGVLRSLVLAAVVAADARAQKVLLELRPQAGDTLRMQLDQVSEMSVGRKGVTPTQVTTTLRMFSRAIVESTAPIASLILAVTDSVEVSSSDTHARALGDQAERELEGRQMRLRLWPDGTVTLNDGAGSVPREVRDLVSVMPASFPSKPVGIGDSWVREMPIPSGTALGIAPGGVVRTRFRFDSISPEGDLAYLTMVGTLQTVVAVAVGGEEPLAGSVNGSMVVNRKRGWLSESHFLLQLRSTVAQNGKAGGDPMRFRMTVRQDMKVLSRATPRRQR